MVGCIFFLRSRQVQHSTFTTGDLDAECLTDDAPFTYFKLSDSELFLFGHASIHSNIHKSYRISLKLEHYILGPRDK